jgi:tetratricopeptide (TPR) repeat protein
LLKPANLSSSLRGNSIKIQRIILSSDSLSIAIAFFLLVMVFAGVNTSSVKAADEPAKFVGSTSCIQCHQDEYGDWLKSDHRKAMQPANKDTVLGDFDDVTVSFHGIDTRLFWQGGEFKVSTTGADGKPGLFTIQYTFGHYPLQQYLIDIGKGHLQALNLAWDSRAVEQGGQRWYHLQANEDIDAEHPFYWMRHFQNSNSRCIECHGTNVRKNFDPVNRSYNTNWSEISVGCEACHGPASRHVALASANKLEPENSGFNKKAMPGLSWAFRGDDDIASPSGSKNEDHIDTCGGCHSRRSSIGDTMPLAAFHDQYRLALLDQGLYFADGQIDDEVFVFGSFLQSKMQQKGVTCSNCHNVHSGKLIAQGNALCSQCHKASSFDTLAHHHHQPGSSGAQCVSCHMPERLYMSVDMRRDHSFTIPDPRLSAGSNAPNACTTCHQGKTDQWAIKAMSSWGMGETQNVWAAINQGLDKQDSLMFKNYASSPPALSLAPIRQATLISKLAGFPSRLAVESAAPQLANPDPLIRRAAVSALQAMPVELRWQLLSPLIEDPVKVIRLEVASALVDALTQVTGKDAEKLGKLIEEYRESLDYNADTPAGQLTIGNLEARLGFSILAENAYLRSLEIEPHYVPALINLSDFYRSSDRDPESRELLLRALQVAPDSANTNHAYGLFLVRSGKQNEALKYLEKAIGQQDSNPRYVYVYAVALDSRGQTDAAMKVIDEAGKRWPNNLELSFLQVSYMDKTGKTDGIHRYLSLLASIAANNPQVRLWMNKYSAGGNF